jgi:2-polyprenyl-3-methyl-5-hydroxy-6-metoxy-1,4-benzoquinol methylase
MDDPIRNNLAWWNERVPIHVRSPFYDVEGFLGGRDRLMGAEEEELGDVAGLRLLHLQCHFGLTTLTLARRGAEVVGVDFSPAAVEQAAELARRAGLEDRSRFVCSDVLALPGLLDETFDVVFASYGVLPWIPDASAWMRVAASHLRPGGRLHLLDFHPFAKVFDDEHPDGIRVRHDYWHEPAGRRGPQPAPTPETARRPWRTPPTSGRTTSARS